MEVQPRWISRYCNPEEAKKLLLKYGFHSKTEVAMEISKAGLLYLLAQCYLDKEQS